MQIKEEEDDPEIIKNLVIESVTQAIENLDKMRATEGKKLQGTLVDLVANIKNIVEEISQLAPVVAEEYRQKLSARMTEILQNVVVDEARLANEVAFFTDKSNIDEEIARLKSHVYHITQIFDEEQPVGRKLDFLVQEFNREANTVCSKSNHLPLTNLGLALKNEIEKVREQIQNVE